jgi:predicted AlkP superfamily pyrophosphatase or phosphodiesterase
MYTGVLPAVHGIQKYEKPVIKTDSFFDALIRAGKKVAIVATNKSSMSMIFAERDMDIIICDTEANVVETAQTMIIEDKYDVICVYTIGYDKIQHRKGTESPEALAAAYREGTIFDQLVSTVRRNWTKHNTLVAFSPDHGAHDMPPETVKANGLPLLGNHGDEIPRDLNILHYLGVVLKKQD